MSFDQNQRVIRPNERLEALVEKQTAVLEKILEKLDELAAAMAEGNDVMIDQNGSIKAKLDDANVNLGYVLEAIQTSG